MDKHYLKVKNHPSLLRDPNSKAIIVMDQTARQNYINQKTQAQRVAQTTDKLQDEIGSLREEINDLKDMLRTLINNSKTDK